MRSGFDQTRPNEHKSAVFARQSGMRKTTFTLATLLVLSAVEERDSLSKGESVIDVGLKKQLFIDEMFIASRHGVELTVNPPRKTQERNLVPDPDRPWEAVRVAYPSTVMEDQGKYRMWYDAMFDRQPEDQLPHRLVCYAESEDGIHWRKPVVGSHAFRGSSENNISVPTAPGTVFIDPNASAAQRYKYFGRNRVAMLEDKIAGSGLWVYASPDGLSFKPLYGRPAMRYVSDTHDVAFWDPVIDKYVAYIKYVGIFDAGGGRARVELPPGVREGRKVWRMTTDRLDQWPQPSLVLAMDTGDRRDADFYNSAAIRYPYADRAYFLFPSAYYHYVGEGARRNDGPMDIQLAVSRDGIHFSRPSRSPFVRRGMEGSYDGGHMYMGRGVLRSRVEFGCRGRGLRPGRDSGCSREASSRSYPQGSRYPNRQFGATCGDLEGSIECLAAGGKTCPPALEASGCETVCLPVSGLRSICFVIRFRATPSRISRRSTGARSSGR